MTQWQELKDIYILDSIDLQMAIKTEALLITNSPIIEIDEQQICWKKSNMSYLNIELDCRLNFCPRKEEMANKAVSLDWCQT